MSIRDEVSRNGYVFLPAFARDHSGQEAAALLGAPVTFQTGLVVHRLVPTVQEHSTPNTYSGIYGHGQFPLHTDRANWQHPTRYFMLRCIVGFETVPTFLVDGKDIVEEVGANILTRALVQSRRPMAGSLPLMRLFTPQEGEHGMLRWDDLFIRAASNAGSLGMNNGPAVSLPKKTIEDDEITEVQDHLPARFECIACGLKISGLSKISAVGLGARYKKTQVYDAADYYAPHDEYYGYEEDNNEP